MTFATRLAAVLLAAAPIPVLAQPADSNVAITQFFVEFDTAELARNPESKSYRGIRDADYAKLDHYTDADRAEDNAANVAALAAVRTFDAARLTPGNALSQRLFVSMLERRIAAYRFRDHGYVFDQMNGAQSDIPAFLINIHRIDTKADAEAYIARLGELGRAIDENVADARDAATKGIAPPKWVYAQVISDARNVITGFPFTKIATEAPLYEDLKAKVAKLTIPQAEKDALLAAGADALQRSVRPAYLRLIAEMERQQATASTDDGVWRLPDGAAYYAERLRNYTTTDLTPDQIHQLGLDQVARIHSEMREIMTRTNFKGDLKAFFTFMRTDPRFYAPNTEAGRALYLAETEKAKTAVTALLPQYFVTIPKSPMVVKRVEAFREKSAGKAFYQRPAPDGSRPGTYYANLYDMADMPLTEVEALFYHEGIPGHHFQGSIQTELKDMPPFRVFGGGLSAYSEGWGLYSERLAKDMGLYTDPYRDFGRLQLELHRAIRLVVDSGLHHKRWSRETAIKYVEDNSADAPGGIVKAIERYIVYPGQATSYMVGRLKITDLRERARTKLGPKFDIRGFHEVVLSSGAVPLDILEERVDAWIASKA